MLAHFYTIITYNPFNIGNYVSHSDLDDVVKLDLLKPEIVGFVVWVTKLHTSL